MNRFDDLESTVASDGLFRLVLEVLAPERPGLFFACGLYLTDALAGLEPAGLLIATSAEPERAAGALAEAGFAEVAPKRPGGVRVLVPRPATDRGARTGRRVTIVPLEGDIEAHLGRVGYTVCACAMDLAESRPDGLIDPFGGIADLDEKRLRLVAPGALEKEPARVIQAAELRARYGLEPDPETILALKTAAGRLGGVQAPRVWHALSRIMGGSGLSDQARFLSETGVIPSLFPEVDAIKDVPQNYYHHLGVWEHTLETLDNLEGMMDEPGECFRACGGRVSGMLSGPVEGLVTRRAFLSFAALIHDVGKASTMRVEPSGRIRFKGHQYAGAAAARDIATRLGLSYRGRAYLTGVVGKHMALGFLLKEGETAEGRLRTAAEMGSNCVDISVLSLADRMATRGEASTDEGMDRYRRLVNRLLADYFWERDVAPLIGGRDLLVHGGLEQGPDIGRALFRVRVAQREGIVASRAQALEFVAPDFKGRMRC